MPEKRPTTEERAVALFYGEAHLNCPGAHECLVWKVAEALRATRRHALLDAAEVDPRSVFCPICTAEEGDWCWWPPGPNAVQGDACHEERWRAALKHKGEDDG